MLDVVVRMVLNFSISPSLAESYRGEASIAWSSRVRRNGMESCERMFREKVSASKVVESIRVCTEGVLVPEPNIGKKRSPD